MKAVGIILAGGNSKRMGELTQKRAIAAMPVGACFRCIDYALSNMSNSHVQTVAVLTQYHTKSLNRHLSSSKWWDFGRKQGGLYLFAPMVTADSSDWYRGTADAMYQNMDFLKKCHEPYVVIASGDCVYKMDYNKVLEYHIEKKADITVVCKDMPNEADITRYGVVKLDEDSRITEFEEKPLQAFSNTISTGVYVIRRRLLMEILETAAEEGRTDFVTDVLIRYRHVKRIYGYKMDTYWKNIASIADYYQTNMDMLSPQVRGFFREEPKIYTKMSDFPPAKYNPGADLHNSLVASGCIINGKVENSVLFRKVFVGKDCVIKNSIILNEVYIGDNTTIENCIVESGVTLNINSHYSGEHEIKVITENNDRYTI